MNIFYLDHNPRTAAEMMHDKHVVKMILETAQILSSVCHRHDTWIEEMYRPTHKNHPSVLWAGDSADNFWWLYAHGLWLCKEFEYRYNHHHKSSDVIELMPYFAPKQFPLPYWTPPPQAMPDEFKIAGDSVAAYRAYYLGRKVEQSGWTRRPVPTFVLEGKANMAKKKQVESAETSTSAAADAPAAPKNAPGAPIGARGPKGVALDAIVSLKVEGNPKRPGSKAHDVFAQYVDGMTVQQFLDAVGQAATPNLVYDAAHGFIAIEGYDPKLVLKKERAPKAEEAPKEPKAPRGKKAKAASAEAAPASVDDVAVEETID
jgi:hypothetical protein